MDCLSQSALTCMYHIHTYIPVWEVEGTPTPSKPHTYTGCYPKNEPLYLIKNSVVNLRVVQMNPTTKSVNLKWTPFFWEATSPESGRFWNFWPAWLRGGSSKRGGRPQRLTSNEPLFVPGSPPGFRPRQPPSVLQLCYKVALFAPPLSKPTLLAIFPVLV